MLETFSVYLSLLYVSGRVAFRLFLFT